MLFTKYFYYETKYLKLNLSLVVKYIPLGRMVSDDTLNLSPRYLLSDTELIMIERYILKQLGFAFYRIVSDHPHKYLLYYIKVTYHHHMYMFFTLYICRFLMVTSNLLSVHGIT